MQELRIKQEMDSYTEIFSLSDEECAKDNLLISIEDGLSINSIVIEKYDAKQIVSFLQNHFNL